MTDNSFQIANAVRDVFQSENEFDRNNEPANVVDGLFAIARSMNRVADALYKLGNGDASGDIGAIEGLAMIVKESTETLASAIADRPV